MGRLEGRAALITGAARGIGLAIAAAFVAEGACVALADPDAAAAAASAREIGGVPLNGDVSDPTAAELLVAGAIETMGGLHGLANEPASGAAARRSR
jgi:NAD(P)-dependent dehydrogenase (short-subunit alcohol dehydrogenase family)